MSDLSATLLAFNLALIIIGIVIMLANDRRLWPWS